MTALLCYSWKLVFDCMVFDPLDWADIKVISLPPFELDVLRGFWLLVNVLYEVPPAVPVELSVLFV